MQSLVAGDKFDRSKAQALVAEKTAAVGTKSPEVIAALGDFYTMAIGLQGTLTSRAGAVVSRQHQRRILDAVETLGGD